MKSDAPRSSAGHPAGGVDPDSDLAGALHEVSNALTVVLGWLEAARSKSDDGEARAALDVARVHAHLGHVIARRAIGAEAPSVESARSVLSVARDAAVGVTHEAARAGVRVEFDDAGADDVVINEAPSVLQILLNLLLNAISFSPANDAVVLEVRTTGVGVTFAVTDSGPGIEPQQAKRLFTHPSSTRATGAGIGLYHCHALATSKGGELRLVASEKGARFELSWPAGEIQSTVAAKSSPRLGVYGQRLLIVEDDQAVLSLLEMGLGSRGASVVTATSLRELDEATSDERNFDAALVDLSPIEADPAGALKQLRSRNPGLPIIVISGTAVGPPEGTEGQISGWVRKPFELGEIFDVLSDVSERPSGV